MSINMRSIYVLLVCYRANPINVRCKEVHTKDARGLAPSSGALALGDASVQILGSCFGRLESQLHSTCSLTCVGARGLTPSSGALALADASVQLLTVL